MARFGIGWSTLLLMLAFMAACTSDGGASGSAEPTTSSNRASGHSERFGTRHVTLTCADAIGVSAVAPAKAGLTVWDVVFEGFSTFMSSVPRAEDVGLRLPHGVHWYFRKAPIVLKADVTTVTVSVGPPEQALAWVPSDVWTSGTPPDLGQWSARSVTLQNCPGKTTSFLGGMLAARPNACLVLHVHARGGSEQNVWRRLDGRSCTS
jgi:hypothetical protein